MRGVDRDVAVVGKEPEGSATVLQAGQYPQHGNEQQHVEQADDRPHLSGTGYGPAPVGFREPRGDGDQRRGLGRGQYEREDGCVVAPDCFVAEAVRDAHEEADDSQHGQHAAEHHTAPEHVAVPPVAVEQVAVDLGSRGQGHRGPVPAASVSHARGPPHPGRSSSGR